MMVPDARMPNLPSDDRGATPLGEDDLCVLGGSQQLS
jgi:hypothetical protein